MELFHEYEAGKSQEARLVKDFDKARPWWLNSLKPRLYRESASIISAAEHQVLQPCFLCLHA